MHIKYVNWISYIHVYNLFRYNIYMNNICYMFYSHIHELWYNFFLYLTFRTLPDDDKYVKNKSACIEDIEEYIHIIER
jgi:hypothetical protein